MDRQPTASNVARRWVARSVVTSLLILTTASLWLWHLAVQERDRARTNEQAAEQSRHEVETQRNVAQERLEQARRSVYALQLSRVAAMDLKDSDAALRLLEDPQRCPLDLREFTWSYYMRLFGGQKAPQRVLTDSKVAVRAIALSPDGRTIAVPAPHGIQLLDLDSDEKRALGGPGGNVISLAFSPDGKSLAAVTRSEAWLVDPGSGRGKKLLEGSLHFAMFSRDGKILAIGGDGEVFLWDVAKSVSRTLFTGLRGRVVVAAFSPDSRTLATGGWDNSVRIWDAATGAERFTLKGHTAIVIGLAFSADGSTLNSMSGTARIPAGPKDVPEAQKPEAIVWDLSAGGHTGVVQAETDVPVITALAISPDGRTLATGHVDGSVALRNPHTWEQRATLRTRNGPVLALEFSRDGLRLASGSGAVASRAGRDTRGDTQGAVHVWEVDHWKNSAVLRGSKGVIHGLSFHGTRLLSASGYEGGRVVTPAEGILWDTVTGQPRHVYQKFDDAVYAAAIAPEGKRIVLAAKSALRLLDLETGKERVLAKAGSTDAHTAFSPDGKAVAWAGGRGSVDLLDASNGKGIAVLEARGPAAFSSDGRTLATVGEDGFSAVLWDYPSGKRRKTLHGHSEAIYSLAFSPDGAVLATGSGDNSVRLWDSASAKPLATLAGHAGAVRAVAFSPSGKLLAAGAGSGRISPGEFRLWDLETGGLVKVVPERVGAVTAVAFSSDGSLLATAGRSAQGRAHPGEIRLWLVTALR